MSINHRTLEQVEVTNSTVHLRNYFVMLRAHTKLRRLYFRLAWHVLPLFRSSTQRAKW